MLSSVVIIVIFNLIRLIWKCHKDGKATRAQQGTPEECAQAAEWAAAMQSRMETRSLGRYLLKDFRFSEQITPEEMKSETLLQKKMTRMMRELHAYLCLVPGYTLSVRFDRDNSMDRSGQCDYSNKKIEIYPRSYYSADTLMAILAHETAHYFMYQYGLSDPDKDLNERYTDVVSSLIGFSSCRVNGNIGYLKRRQFIAVRDCLLKYRNQHAKTKAESCDDRESAARIREQMRLRSQLSAADVLLKQAKAIIRVKKVPTRPDLAEQDYCRLKAIVNRLDEGKYDSSLAFCSGLLQGNLTNLLTGQEDVLRVCSDLNTVMRMYA